MVNNQNIIVLGLGGCGGQIVKNLSKVGLEGANCIICNAGMQKAEIVAQLSQLSTEMLFIVVGMGHESGAGVRSLLVAWHEWQAHLQQAKRTKVEVIAVMPFAFEGQKRRQQAETDVSLLRKYVDKLIVLENDQLLKKYSDAPAAEGFAIIDRAVREAIISAASTV